MNINDRIISPSGDMYSTATSVNDILLSYRGEPSHEAILIFHDWDPVSFNRVPLHRKKHYITPSCDSHWSNREPFQAMHSTATCCSDVLLPYGSKPSHEAVMTLPIWSHVTISAILQEMAGKYTYIRCMVIQSGQPAHHYLLIRAYDFDAGTVNAMGKTPGTPFTNML